jgi:tetratricopeptide (TPR) repeat protein
MGKNMDFNVIIDTEDEFMGKNWMTAAGQGGIPTSMMVKDGIIQWMGHPINLDSIVTLVMSGKYDVATARKTAVERANRAPSAQQVAIAKVNKQIADEVKAKRYDEASRITDSVTATLSVEQAVVLNWNKFNMLLDFVGEKEAVDFLKKWFSTYSGFRGSAGATLVHKEGLSKETYMFAINMLKPLIDNPQPGSLVYNMIANAYANMGDYKSAVDAQELAIVKAREYLKNEKFIGFVTEDQIKEYQEKILKYKAQIK